MQMIAHDSKAQNIYSEDSCQEFQPLTNPLPAMRVILFGLPILPAQMRPADTAVDDMEHLNFTVRNNLSSIHPWHTCRSTKPRWKSLLVTIKRLICFVKVHGTRIWGRQVSG
jgi:hypothetical protein